LTGPSAEVQKFCERFGVAFFPDEGQLIHSLHTLIIDRQGKLAANLEGNEFTAEELGDLVQSVLRAAPRILPASEAGRNKRRSSFIPSASSRDWQPRWSARHPDRITARAVE
jgi:hypothetical protein